MGVDHKRARVVLVGGTRRATRTLRALVDRDDIDFSSAIFMPGYQDERHEIESFVAIAQRAGIPTIIADRVTPELVERSQAKQCDAIIGIGVWRSVLPIEFLRSATLGFLAVHGTPVPAYRGWAGIYWQVINGEKRLTMRALQLDAGLDGGPLVCDASGELVEASIDLENELHIGELLEEYDLKHVDLVQQLLNLVRDRTLSFREQEEPLATYSCHRGPDDGEINWSGTTRDTFNFIRAQSRPLAGAFTYFRGRKIALWRVRPRYDYANYVGRIYGKVVTRDSSSGHVVILTADGGIEVAEANIYGEAECQRPVELFSSVRDRCMSGIEAWVYRLARSQKNPEKGGHVESCG